jgi:hypothetical protein
MGASVYATWPSRASNVAMCPFNTFYDGTPEGLLGHLIHPPTGMDTSRLEDAIVKAAVVQLDSALEETVHTAFKEYVRHEVDILFCERPDVNLHALEVHLPGWASN